METKQSKDLHFSGYQVSEKLMEELLRFGFVRDMFTNNTRCARTQFHATYRGGRVINNQLYAEVCTIIKKHPQTIADLEMERCPPEYQVKINSSAQPSLSMDEIIEPFTLKDCPVGKKKAADLHITCDMKDSSAFAFFFMENLKMISFDRPLESGFKRIYTITFENASDAIVWFERFHQILSKVHLFTGKIKLEFLEKQFRIPDNAPVLPLVHLT